MLNWLKKREKRYKNYSFMFFRKREFKLKKEYLDVLLKEEAVMGIIKSLENRRTYYNIDKNLPVLEKRD